MRELLGRECGTANKIRLCLLSTGWYAFESANCALGGGYQHRKGNFGQLDNARAMLQSNDVLFLNIIIGMCVSL